MNSQDNIVGGLRNALERGDDLKAAGETFINAGYDKSDVKAAMDIVLQPAKVKAREEVKPIIFKPIKQEEVQKVKIPFLQTKAAIITGIVGVIFIILLLIIWLFNVLFS